ncbi:MAG: PAS domain-containing protein [Nitrospirae bacterium]|nr:PAS domain-containing protein [Nitrospirota bacterium]
MADSLPVLISYVDAERRYRFANRNYEKYLGLAQDEINGRLVKDILGEEAYNGISPNMDRALAGENITFERAFSFAKSGETFLKINYVPDFGAHGRVKGFFVLGYDITAQKKTELLLRRYAKHLSDMEESQNKKLAMELHDRIGPNLTAMGINLSIVMMAKLGQKRAFPSIFLRKSNFPCIQNPAGTVKLY